MKRRCRRGCLSEGLALALSAAVLLAGCAVASEEGDEKVDETLSELDPVTFEQASGSTDQDDGRARESIDSVELPARGATRVPGVEERPPTTTGIRSKGQEKMDPAPIPWQPQERSEVSSPGSSDSDGTR